MNSGLGVGRVDGSLSIRQDSRGDETVTVCIAAICDFDGRPLILVASDRKVTAGDIEFEPNQSKVFRFTNSILALTAGDSQLQTEVCNLTLRRIDAAAVVEDVVRFYGEEIAGYKLRQAERTVLAPFGINMQEFLDRQKDWSPEFRDDITLRIRSVKAGVATIITGVDRFGPHIYIVDGFGNVVCNDAVGFAAIGDGKWHAESQFMFARYVPRMPIHEALLLTYSAKKRAEVAPGVGKDTDVFIVLENGNFIRLSETLEAGVDAIYESRQVEYKQADEKALAEMSHRVHNALTQGQQDVPATIQSPPTASASQPAADTSPSTSDSDHAP
jgi:20S proteasome alpha/beta subunit